MTKVLTSVVAALIGAVWILGPAAAQTTTDKMENKTERAKDKVEDKAEQAKDKTESKTESAMDKVKEKAHEAKEKIVETKDKVVDKVKGKKNKVAAKSEETNVRAAQQALRDQGYNPGPHRLQRREHAGQDVLNLPQGGLLVIECIEQAEDQRRVGIRAGEERGQLPDHRGFHLVAGEPARNEDPPEQGIGVKAPLACKARDGMNVKPVAAVDDCDRSSPAY